MRRTDFIEMGAGDSRMPLNARSLDLDFRGRLGFGVGSVERIGELVAGCGGMRAFIVTDPGVSRAGVTDLVRQEIPRGMDSVVFEGVTPNPTTDDVESGTSALTDFGTEGTVVVAAGGGSAAQVEEIVQDAVLQRAPYSA